VTDAVAVLPAADLPPGGRATVEAFGTEIALFNVDGALFALANACPHYGGPLCRGRVTGTRLPSEPYEHRYGREGRVLVCPWHGWEFDLETGRAVFDEDVSVRVFDISVEDGSIVVGRRRRAESGDR
jgi:nitrite reductase (NADH) small subunit